MAALEAMAHGIPVAAFELGALPELIQNDENGWIVPPGDLNAMAGVVKRWAGLSESQKAGMRNAAVETIRAAYSPQAVLPQVLAVYAAAGMPQR